MAERSHYELAVLTRFESPSVALVHAVLAVADAVAAGGGGAALGGGSGAAESDVPRFVDAGPLTILIDGNKVSVSIPETPANTPAGREL